MPDVSRSLSWRWLALPLAAVAVVAGALVVENQRREAAAAAQLEHERATEALIVETSAIRSELLEPVGEAYASAAALSEVTSEVLLGSERDLDEVREDLDTQLAALRAATDELSAVERTEGPTITDTHDASLRAVRDELDAVEHEAILTAEVLATAADAAEELALAAHALTETTTELVDRTDGLDHDDDPEVVAETWREELELVTPYREAAERASELEPLADLAGIHLDVVEQLESTAEASIAALEEEDLDAYDERREQAREALDDLPERLLEALGPAHEEVLQFAQQAQGRAAGLLERLEGLPDEVGRQLREASV